MSSRPSRTSPISLLKGDGALEPLALRPGLFQPGFVVLARERCLFENFPVAQGLAARSASTAARLHADTAAPYQRYGALITHKGRNFGIWWWDAAWVAEKLAAAGLDPDIRVIPEPLVRAGAEGWRVVKASSGYEAQLWKQGFLVADLWRRAAFDNSGWQDFVRVQADQTGADSAVLMPQDAPWTLQSSYRRMMLSEWTPERTTRFAVAAGIAVILMASLYLVGDALGLRRQTEDLKARTAQLNANASSGQGLQAELRGMAALRTALDAPNAMQQLQGAQEIIEPFGYKIVSFDTNLQGLTIVLPKEAVGDLEGISRQLAASPLFSNVRPTLDRDGQRLTIAMTAKKPKVKAKNKSVVRAKV